MPLLFDDYIRLEPFNLHFTAKRPIDGGMRVYFCTKLKGVSILFELAVGNQNRVACKSSNKDLSVIGAQAMLSLVSN